MWNLENMLKGNKKTPTNVEVKQEPVEVPIKDTTKKVNKSKKMKDDIEKMHEALRKKWINVKSPSTPRVISTGIWAIDIMLWGWYAMNGVSEVAWWESAGKTTLALHGIKAAQKEWLKCVFLDYERTLTDERLIEFGIDIDKLLRIQPKHIEDGFESIRTLLWSGYNYFVWDSIWAAMPAWDIEWDMWAERMMRRGRVNSIGFNQMIPLLDDNNAFLLLINQYYSTPDQYNPKATKGGGTIAYVCRQRMELTRKTTEKWQIKNMNGDPIGQEVMVKINKLKILNWSPQSKHAIALYYDGRYNDYIALMDLANKYGVLTKEWLTYFYNGDKIWRKSELIDFVKENRESIKKETLIKLEENIKNRREEMRKRIDDDMLSEDDINF